MRHQFLKNNSSDNLTLLFAGWGMSASDFWFLKDTETDLLVCSDYRVFDFDTALLMPYANVRLVGYSLGVWAASYVFRDKKITFSETIAINGTPFPVDDTKGIPVKIYEGTEAALSDVSLQKFFRRMCGSKENFQEFMAHTEAKNITELKDELRTIQRLSAKNDVSSFRWNKAVISENDAIFPPSHQREAWNKHTEITMLDTPHFSPFIFKEIV